VVSAGYAPREAGFESVEGCEQADTQVRMAPDDPASYRLVGWLCGPRNRGVREVDLLVHGATYTHLYWMGLGQFAGLDYVRYASAARQTTFVIDQLGAGASDHPDPDRFTLITAAYVLHQVVTGLRTGQIGAEHLRFQRVIGVGHSMGSRAWQIEAGTWHDTDAVVVLDGLHATNPPFITVLQAHTVQANTLPRFAHLPAGYLTIQMRSLFYDTGLAAPRVISRDEQVADTNAARVDASLGAARDPRYSTAIRVPVLLVTGRTDALECDPVRAGLSCADPAAVIDREGSMFTGAPCLQAYVVDGGHDTNLHPAAPHMFNYINTWIDAVRLLSSGYADPQTRTRTCAVSR
jgi:pimeloyl-ACP methyl ester carboxylesterase